MRYVLALIIPTTTAFVGAIAYDDRVIKIMQMFPDWTVYGSGIVGMIVAGCLIETAINERK